MLISGNYKKGLRYHQQEISLSEAAGDQIGTAIAHRKVGECFCELGDYQDAIHHQKQHLRIARCLGKSIYSSTLSLTMNCMETVDSLPE